MLRNRIGLIAVLFLSNNVFALEGVVIGVSDGDTITVLDASKNHHKIRLAQIDAPEKNQPWGSRSKQALSDLVYAKNVEVEVVGKDRFEREIGTVYLGRLDVCKEQIKNGNAWAYAAYVKDESLFSLEREAKKKKSGLWSNPHATAPWLWRKEK